MSSSPTDSQPKRAGAARRGFAASGGALKSTGRGIGRAGRGLGRGVRRLGRFTGSTVRRASRAEGAGDTGLYRLIELHAVNSAGDAAVAISLAGTFFFQVPTGEARSQVALFLGMTMLPFVIVAPLIGPFLDRFAHGRRWAIGATMAIRAFLCWVLADAVRADSRMLFAAALGCLVASKAYQVTRAAAVPRLRPESLTLVKANGRMGLAGVVGAAISAPLAAGAASIGAEWSLRYAFALFVIATIAAILLPARVDSSAGEQAMSLTSGTRPAESGTTSHPREDSTTDPETGPEPNPDNDLAADHGATSGTGSGTQAARRRLSMHIPSSVAFALLANCGPRWMSGFLTMFMAFLLRVNPIEGWRTEVLMGVVIGAAGLGNIMGIALASLTKRINPRTTVVVAVAADAVMAAVGAAFYGVITLGLLGLTAGIAQSLAKMSLDATIQADVPERVQTSAFARSDTALQTAWVIGGFIGIALPLIPRLGLGVAAGLLGLWTAHLLWRSVKSREAWRAQSSS